MYFQCILRFIALDTCDQKNLETFPKSLSLTEHLDTLIIVHFSAMCSTWHFSEWFC